MRLGFCIVLISVLLTGCATFDYFTKPDNQQKLVDMGITCFKGPDLKAGAAYIIKKDGMSVNPTTSGEFLIGCEGKWFTVVCDFTKGPEENPCSGIKRYDEVIPAVAVPAVEETTYENTIEEIQKDI